MQEPEPPLELPAKVLPKPPFEAGPHTRVVEYNDFARCQNCAQQTGKVLGKYKHSYVKRQECRPFRKTFRQRVDGAAEVEPPAPQVEPGAGIG
eukprot:1419072-Amphidinium_carterae.2